VIALTSGDLDFVGDLRFNDDMAQATFCRPASADRLSIALVD
jgi:hypothetical protein